MIVPVCLCLFVFLCVPYCDFVLICVAAFDCVYLMFDLAIAVYG